MPIIMRMELVFHRNRWGRAGRTWSRARWPRKDLRPRPSCRRPCGCCRVRRWAFGVSVAQGRLIVHFSGVPASVRFVVPQAQCDRREPWRPPISRNSTLGSAIRHMGQANIQQPLHALPSSTPTIPSSSFDRAPTPPSLQAHKQNGNSSDDRIRKDRWRNRAKLPSPSMAMCQPTASELRRTHL